MNDPSITEEDISRLVPIFYQRVRADLVLGPVFNDAVHDWPQHLGTLEAFWSSVMLTSGRYEGNPVAAHMKHLGQITPSMFDRWLALWTDVTDETLAPAAATAFQHKAERIVESLKLALYFRLPTLSGSSSPIADIRS